MPTKYFSCLIQTAMVKEILGHETLLTLRTQLGTINLDDFKKMWPQVIQSLSPQKLPFNTTVKEQFDLLPHFDGEQADSIFESVFAADSDGFDATATHPYIQHTYKHTSRIYIKYFHTSSTYIHQVHTYGTSRTSNTYFKNRQMSRTYIHQVRT